MQSLAAGGHRISGAVDVVEKVGEEEEEEARHVVAVAVVVNEIEVVQLAAAAAAADRWIRCWQKAAVAAAVLVPTHWYEYE
jgi:type IV secretory pathway VirD2 relaxase|tara:strand:+ start:725 stop:967 length:243 start_codon:yes stop_codon:yes gene_type:complete